MPASVDPPSLRLGIDLGGTKIAAIVLDADGRVRWETEIPTPRGDYDGTIAAMRALVHEGEIRAGGPCTIGIGTPGAISPATGFVKNANSTWLNGRPFHADIERAFGRDVRLANDANCLAMSEAADGAAANAPIVFAVIVGTGTGAGIAIDGRILTGANAIAGEWGHNPLPWPESDEWPGPPCYCGRRGCIETFLSGPGLAADYRRRGGEDVTARIIVDRAGTGEVAAEASLAAWLRRLAKALASVINVLDPHVVVLGGGLSRISAIYERVPALWREFVFSDRVETRIVPARFGAASGVRGAARLWDHR